ncbi:thymidylate synthase [Purpureocillium lavendulum]|uniref:Thymidylate synthase n=1 Tax=Purpureocillium lavendulum TaxID=1247861 RepID=A0AB34FMP2_9HYPO|nr:thymidylate synthase [Purpureocillium lavendulum]
MPPHQESSSSREAGRRDRHTNPRYSIAHHRLEREQRRRRRAAPRQTRYYVPSPLVQCWNQDSVATPPASKPSSACSSPEDDLSLTPGHHSPPSDEFDESRGIMGFPPPVEPHGSETTGHWLSSVGGFTNVDEDGDGEVPRRSVGELVMRPEQDYPTIFHELSLLEWQQKQRQCHYHIQQPAPQHLQQHPPILQPPIGTGRPVKSKPQPEQPSPEQRNSSPLTSFAAAAAAAAATIAWPMGPLPSVRQPANDWAQHCPTPFSQPDQWRTRLDDGDGEHTHNPRQPWHSDASSSSAVDPVNPYLSGHGSSGAGLGLTGVLDTGRAVIRPPDEETNVLDEDAFV